MITKLNKRKIEVPIDKKKLEASLCRRSFFDFVQRFWGVIIPEEPVWNWHIEALCSVLQESAEGVFRGEPKKYDLVINIPPGTTKSTICSVMFPAWCWTRMATARTICASYSHDLALDLSRKSRDIIQSDRWLRLFGDIEIREDQNTKGHYVNTKGGDRYCTGTNGTVTGFHAHFIIIDDPIDPNRAMSEADLKTANRWVTETLKTRKVDKAVTVTILIMQRLHQNDPAAVILKKALDNGYPIKHINLPAEIKGTGRDVVRPRKWAKNYVEGLLDPVRLPRYVLRQLEIELGQFAYSGQMLQRPVPLGGGMFKIDRIRIEIPPPLHTMRIVRFWDKAGTQDGGAYTAGVKMARDTQGRFWFLDVVRGQWESSARENTIKQTARIDSYQVKIGIEQEPGSGGKDSALASIKNLAGYVVIAERPTGDKVLRADPLSVQVNGENMFMAPGNWNKALLEELQFFPFSTYKDQVDAASGAFLMLTRAKVRVGGLGVYDGPTMDGLRR